jgi:hypothetical protein
MEELLGEPQKVYVRGRKTKTKSKDYVIHD